MDCSLVLDENELATVFQGLLPISFHKLIINANSNLKMLRKGDLGKASFKEIWITQGELEEVQKGTLSGSFSTLRHMIFNDNKISSFPFADLHWFKHLESLDLRRNNIVGFPQLSSATLKALYLSRNPLGELPNDAFFNTLALEDIQLSSSKIPRVFPDTFDGLKNMTILALGDNLLTHLEEGAVHCNAEAGVIDMGYNLIERVAANAFSGMHRGWWLYIHHNELRQLEEHTWKPILVGGGYVDTYGNPLECGCDLAWALGNITFSENFDIYTTCADGRQLKDLNPIDFEYCNSRAIVVEYYK